MYKLIFSFLLLFWGFWGCASDNGPSATDPHLTAMTCVECHTSQADLVALAEEPSEVPGEAGEG